jgi:outer membrane protein OmpA-like peptidoglycan-associated protein
MKTLTKLITAATLVAGSAVQAEPISPRTEAKVAGTFLTSAVVGAVAGGPIGMFAAALGGAWMGEQIKEADRLDSTEQQLAQRDHAISELSARLREAEQSQQRYAQLALDQLQLEMLFRTGESAISRAGESRLAMLAELLQLNPDIRVRLDGYADPRGGSDYNRQLSAQRVQAVIETLAEFGIDPARLAGHSHGAESSRAAAGDYDAYALERVVRITLLTEGEKEVARAEIR